ncbi:hypothetical protein K8R66_03605, partial [bacterium]|nr:hypothetical protein [bacterium]
MKTKIFVLLMVLFIVSLTLFAVSQVNLNSNLTNAIQNEDTAPGVFSTGEFPETHSFNLYSNFYNYEYNCENVHADDSYNTLNTNTTIIV